MSDLFEKPTVRIKDFIPGLGKSLVNVTRNEVIDKVGRDVIARIVASILCGDNVRSLTEGLTRRRLSLSNASMIYAYTEAMNSIPEFSKTPAELIKREFTHKKLTKEEKTYLNWMVGLSTKGIQNILRSSEDITEYLETLNRELIFAADVIRAELGEITATVSLNDKQTLYGLENLLHLMMAIGAQTLAIRGSEKSVYGKMFERLVLGSLLSLFGFTHIQKDDVDQSEMVFWLSERVDKREADATLLVRAGIGARFDIGFIGKGNSEISLDKVSRFEREVERGRQTHFMSTIILVDTIGEKSGIQRMAKEIDGEIVQMSMSFWVKAVARIFEARLGLDSPFLHLDDDGTLKYIADRMQDIDLHTFIAGMKETEEEKAKEE